MTLPLFVARSHDAKSSKTATIGSQLIGEMSRVAPKASFAIRSLGPEPALG